MLINLGKIQPNPRGDWNSESTYTYLDIVRYANSSYICINNTAEIKNEIPTDSPNYCLIVKDGADLLLRKTETTIEWSRQGENDWHFLLNLADIRGDQGIEGEIGERGPEGAQGPRGFTGLPGPQGIQGIKGDQGIRGEKGEQGIQGEQGLRGEQGIQGEQGIKGDQGIRGDKGDQGNPLLALENQNTLAEAILQENLLINNIYDRLEGGIYAAI